ncbi:MAG: flagellar biosynthesis protein FlhF [Desulfobulbaceae bacterium DB1]|nr:MAG: flagellar biosynthesis protein FlhF [Desulfobulbaceae bacterium DB1]
MRIRRFEAPDSKTAFALVKKELGDSAVILANKTLNAGTADQRYEVLAAMDYDLEEITVPLAASASPAEEKTTGAIYGYDTFRPKQRETNAAATNRIPKRSEQEISLESHDLRMRFAGILRQKGVQAPMKTKSTAAPSAPTPPSRPDPQEVSRWRDQLISRLQVAPPDFSRRKKPIILALTGPTGVGKTTTSAKIAAWYKIREKRRVALISMDCYRIGATDQMRTYARIMQLPCEIVLRRRDLLRSVERHRDCDLIIIDTAGKSPYDAKHISELADWFAPLDQVDLQLVLSAPTKKEDLEQIITAYSPLAPAGLILTKLDETRAYAALCQQIAGAEIPISFLTTGQKVPEDFFVASVPFLERLFKKGWSAVMEAENSYSGNGI